MTASSYKVGDKTYISESGINANNQKVVNVAAGDLSANSTDAVNGAQLYQTNERVTGVENKVNKLDSRVDKVGANAAALANLHPLEFDADSKWNIAAAVGGYKGETATAIGAFSGRMKTSWSMFRRPSALAKTCMAAAFPSASARAATRQDATPRTA